jgi:hypothetical protein
MSVEHWGIDTGLGKRIFSCTNLSHCLYVHYKYNVDCVRIKPGLHNERGQVVAQLVDALRYKPEGRGMVSLEFCIVLILPALGSTHPPTNEYQEYFVEG